MKKNRNELFERIYRQHQPMVLQMCLGFVKGDIDTANDLLQEVFISIWNNLDKFKGKSTYKTWIYRITVNTCLQFIKREKKDNVHDLSKLENKAVENSDDAINQNTIKLYEAIGQLKKIDRLIIMMVLENQDYESISEIIGINSVNVRVKIHRIKKRLEKILKQ